MEFTVIICTYNRANNLSPCINALSKQHGIENRDWEVLVVDNNSSDDTPKVVAQLANELPIKIRYARETEQGLNHARNRGIRESQSIFFAYVDDDIIVSETWLCSLLESFEKNDADAVGGRIHLDPSVNLPAWIRPDTDMIGFLGYQDFGETPLRLDGRHQYPFGGNMAFNRRVIEKIGYFNPKLGRKGEGLKRSELFKGAETDYFHRLADSGEVRIFYAPGAIVYHQIKPFQIKKRYFRTIHFNAGYQKSLYDTAQYSRKIFGVPRFYFVQLTRNIFKYAIQTITKGPDRAFRQQMNVVNMVGTMLGYRKQHLNRV